MDQRALLYQQRQNAFICIVPSAPEQVFWAQKLNHRFPKVESFSIVLTELQHNKEAACSLYSLSHFSQQSPSSLPQ